MKRKFISILLVICMLLSVFDGIALAYKPGYTDMASASTPMSRFLDISQTDWAHTYVSALTEIGVISGYKDGTFRPQEPITRAECAKLIILAFGIKVAATARSSFLDVDLGSWMHPYVEAVKEQGIAKGYPDGTFRPNEKLTRAEITAMLVQAAQLETDTAGKPFKDIGDSWAYAHIMTAKNARIVSGYTNDTFAPARLATRAEVAKLVALMHVNVLSVKALNPDIPRVVITSPTDKDLYETHADRISLAGGASDDIKVVSVSWENNRGGSGVAEGTTSWSVANIALRPGNNKITVIATDNKGNKGLASIMVRYTPTGGGGGTTPPTMPPTTPPTTPPDITLPTISISSPVDSSITSDTAPLLVYELSDGQVTTVTIDGIPVDTRTNEELSTLLDGSHIVRIEARDDAGNVGSTQSTFTVDTVAPTLSANPASGLYNAAQSVTLSASEDAAIYYTLDGTTPSDSSIRYLGLPVSIAATAELKFMAIDVAGNTSQVYSQTYTIDTQAPQVTGTAPDNNTGAVSVDATITITFTEDILQSGAFNEISLRQSDGRLIETTKSIRDNMLIIDPISDLARETTFTVSIPAGAIKDAAGNELADVYSFSFAIEAALDSEPPVLSSAVVNGTSLTLTYSEPLDEGSVPLASAYTVKVNDMIQPAPNAVSVLGSKVILTLSAAAKEGQSILLSYAPGETPTKDLVGNQASTLVDQEVLNETVSLAAPPIDPTVATTVYDATTFLYTGDNPVQTGLATDTIEIKRAAVLRGRVVTRDGTPLSEVKITVHKHLEFGSTKTRDDGYFDMAVNGGGVLTVNYEKDGYLPVQRQENVPWQEFALVDDVVMIQLDTKVNVIDLSSNTPIQVAQGTTVTDSDGTRTATLFFTQGTKATMTLSDGTTKDISDLSVRATEYTVGDSGPSAMPAELLPTTGYTYCVEYSVDEAIASGAKRIDFDKPVIQYLDNFIGFPVGEIVPAGYYDREKAAWIPSENGRVVKIHSIENGKAKLVVDKNSSTPADAAKLASLGITDEELAKVATLYADRVGDSFWRVPITHFTPWDCNWPYGPPSDAEPPRLPEKWDNYDITDPCKKKGSIIEVQNQTLGEAESIVGTPFKLHYQSDRVEGRKIGSTLQIPLTGSSIPGSLKSVILKIEVAGRKIQYSFAAAPNLSHTFEWDGKDVYGRTLQGRRDVTVNIGYVYPAVYYEAGSSFARSFGRISGSGMAMEALRRESRVVIWQKLNAEVGHWDSRAQGLGGWSLNVHHVYDPIDKVLYLGNGEKRDAESASSVLNKGGTSWYQGLWGIAVAPDGTVYMSDEEAHRVYKIDPVTLKHSNKYVAGVWGKAGYNGDGISGDSAYLNRPSGLAVGPDGSLYIADSYNHLIRKVDVNGIITTVAGGGYGADGGPAIGARLQYPRGIAVAPDGSLYIADTGNNRIRKVSPDGIITTVAGTGGYANYSGDGGPATKAQLSYPCDVAVAPDGSLYIADTGNNRIRKVSPDGIITTVAGSGPNFYGLGNEAYGDYSGDGDKATLAKINGPLGVEVGDDGTVYIADTGNHCIRGVTPEGIIFTVAGIGKSQGSSLNGTPATASMLSRPCDVEVGPDGVLHIAEPKHCLSYGCGSFYGGMYGQIKPMLPGFSSGEIGIASENGRELYTFDPKGKHLRTNDTLTGAMLYKFNYDQDDHLISIEDRDANITSIERNAGGAPTAIVGANGARTTLSLNNDGYLSDIACPLGKTVQLGYSSDGLLTSLTDRKGGTHSFTYDSGGRLIKDINPAGGYTALTRTVKSNGFEVRATSAMGKSASYAVESTQDGGLKQVNTDEGGAKVETVFGTNGTRKATYADGTVVQLTEGPDPRWGMQAPILRKLTVATPAGKTSTTTRSRTASFSSSDRLNMTWLEDTFYVNGREYKNTFSKSQAKITSTTPKGRSVNITLNEKGRIARKEVSGMEPVNYTYDSEGLLIKVQQAGLFLEYSHDDKGRVSAITDAKGNQRTYAYNDANFITSVTTPGGATYRYGYDANGNRTSVTMPNGAVHGLKYTQTDQDAGYAPPENKGSVKRYDLDGALTQVVLPEGRAVDHSYDNGGRPSGIIYDAANLTFGYDDSTERIASIESSSTTGENQALNFTYDGGLTTEISANGAAQGAYSYRYDNNFFLAGMTLDAEPEVSITRDTDGLLTGYGAFSMTRNGPAGALSQISDGTMSTAFSYDTLGELTQRSQTVGGGRKYNLQLAYDSLGSVTQKTETIAGATHIYNYAYSNDNQLIRVTKDGETVESYAYDANGNRVARKLGSDETETATYDAQDRLTQQGTTPYVINADGFMTKRGATNFIYSARGELTQATLADGRQITYAYDGLGRRVMRKDATGEYQYLYGNPSNPLQITAVRNPSGLLSKYYYDEAGHLFAVQQNSAWYYVATDQVATPKVVTDSSGNVVKALEYDSFGKLISDNNPAFDLPFGFAGGLADKDTGLVCFGFRDYDPAAGRWTARDPILFGGGQGNLYAYVGNNPVNFRDPYGLFCVGGSLYVKLGGGAKVCVTDEGVSVCGEVGAGIGFNAELTSGGLDETGVSVFANAEADLGAGSLGAGFKLDHHGCATMSIESGIGPVSGSMVGDVSTDDFSTSNWDIDEASIGIGAQVKTGFQFCKKF